MYTTLGVTPGNNFLPAEGFHLALLFRNVSCCRKISLRRFLRTVEDRSALFNLRPFRLVDFQVAQLRVD